MKGPTPKPRSNPMKYVDKATPILWLDVICFNDTACPFDINVPYPRPINPPDTNNSQPLVVKLNKIKPNVKKM